MLCKKFMLISLMLLIITISAVSADENITGENMTSADNNEIIKTFEDVQKTIDDAEINSTVVLNGTYEGLGSEILIDKDLTIEGLGKTTLDAQSKSRILTITSSNVILKNINFINARSATNGGAINSTANLTIINCNFQNNTADDGNEYNYYSFEDEYRFDEDSYYHTTGKGGAIYTTEDLTIINSTFTNNSAHLRTYARDMDYCEYRDFGSGGAIESSANIYIEKSNFTNNSQTSINTNNADIRDSNFESTTSYFREVCINNCNFTNKNNRISASKATISNSQFTNGNGILSASRAIINNSQFTNNTIDHNSLISAYNIKISNSTFTNNTARNAAILNVNGEYEITDCTFKNNGDATIHSNNTMMDDSLNPFYLYELIIKDNTTVQHKSEKSIRVDEINVKSGEIIRLKNIRIYINGKYYDDEQFRESIETDEYIISSDYLIFPVSDWNTGTYTIFIEPDSKEIKNLTFEVNVMPKPTAQTNESNKTFEDIQKAIDNAKNNSTVILNGTYEGLGSEILIDKDLTIDGLGKTTLDAQSKSRILTITSSNVILKNINFINARSATNGGAINTTAKLTIINCNFQNNTVDDGNEYNYYAFEDCYYYNTGKGGAIFTTEDLTIINSTFTNNSAHLRTYARDMDYCEYRDFGSGGAIESSAKIYIEKSNFTNNSQISINANNAEIMDCNFDCETLSFDNVYINNCNFTNTNSIISATKAIINNSQFTNNKNDNEENSLIIIADAKIINTIFKNNSVRNTAIMKLGQGYEITGCTFINNSDATIYSNNMMLDDSLKPVYLYEAKVRDTSTLYYNSGKSIRVDEINVNSKKIIRLWDIRIYINGKYYSDRQFRKTVQTDEYIGSSDYLIFPASTWKPGTYTVRIEHTNHNAKSLTFKITVKHILSLKTVKVKKSAKKLVLQATLKNKKPIKGKTVTFKFNGKTYKAKTDSKGIAKVTVKSKVLKKLKVGKKVTYQATYLKDSVKKTVKIKK